MSENGSVFKISQKHTFEFQNGTMTALINDLKCIGEELAEATKPKEGQPEMGHWQFLEMYVERLKGHYQFTDGKPLDISLGEADALFDRVFIEYSKKKASWRGELESLRPSPTSITSTPPE